MGEWDWEGKRCSVNKASLYREMVRGRQSEQKFVCICQLKQTLIQSSHLDQQKVIVPLQ